MSPPSLVLYDRLCHAVVALLMFTGGGSDNMRISVPELQDVVSLPQSIYLGVKKDMSGVLLRLAALFTFTFLYIPIVIVFIMSFSSGTTLMFPPPGFSFMWYENIWSIITTGERTIYGATVVTGGDTMDLLPSIYFSLIVAAVTMVVVTVSGFMAAYSMHRYVFRGRLLIKGAFLLPILFPTLVIGVGLLLFFSNVGLRTAGSEVMMVRNMVLGHSIVSLPYVVILTTAGLAVYDMTVEEAARSLGAGKLRVFWSITMPLVRPSILAAAIIAFNRSLHEFIVTFFLTTGSPFLLPVWIFNYVYRALDPAVAALMVGQMMLLLPALYLIARMVGLERITTGGVGKG